MRSMGVDQYGNEQFVRTNPDGSFELVTKYGNARQTLNRNAQLRSVGHGNGKDMKLAASIPPQLLAKWYAEGFKPFAKENQKELIRRLNSSDFQDLRVWGGQL